MGLAKYLEDNIEIMSERQYLMEYRRQEPIIKSVCSSEHVPLPYITIKVKDEERGTGSVCQAKKFEDRYIICKDCGKKFLFSAHAQKHFDEKDWASPKRCKKCRDYRNTRYLMYSAF